MTFSSVLAFSSQTGSCRTHLRSPVSAGLSSLLLRRPLCFWLLCDESTLPKYLLLLLLPGKKSQAPHIFMTNELIIKKNPYVDFNVLFSVCCNRFSNLPGGGCEKLCFCLRFFEADVWMPTWKTAWCPTGRGAAGWRPALGHSACWSPKAVGARAHGAGRGWAGVLLKDDVQHVAGCWDDITVVTFIAPLQKNTDITALILIML